MSSEKARIESLRGRLKSTKTTATVEDEENDDSLMDTESKGEPFVLKVTSEASEEVQRLLPPETAIPTTSSMRPAAIYTTTSASPTQTENEKSVHMSRAGKGVSFSDQKDVMMKTTYISQDSSESKDSMEMGNLGTGMSGKTMLRTERRAKEKIRKFQRLASMPGDPQLIAYMEELAENPQRFTEPFNKDNGETYLHFLAKEGKLEILQRLLEDPQQQQQYLVNGLLCQDKLKWTPVMAATKADLVSKDIAESCLKFLDENLDTEENLVKLMKNENQGNDTLFTLLMRHSECDTSSDFRNSRKLLFQLLKKHCVPSHAIQLHKWLYILTKQLLIPNSCDLTSRSMKELIYLASKINVNFEKVFEEKDDLGNNILMELAKNMKDDALREVLTNSSTSNYITHTVLLSKNLNGQTLMTLIEVNRESLSESLPIVLKREYGCHRRDLTNTELCLSEQLESSSSAKEIIKELHQLEPKTCCQIFVIWALLFLFSLTPNIGLAAFDIASDAYLTVEYHRNMTNMNSVRNASQVCDDYKSNHTINGNVTWPLKAYAACLNDESKFFYTIAFLLLPLVFYLTEFLTLRDEYEPTGLRQRIVNVWGDLWKEKDFGSKLCCIIKLLWFVFCTFIILVFWQPVTAFCKFFNDGRHDTSEGEIKVERRTEKRYTDLAASRGELIEVNIEAVFEPMVQGYIIFPYIIDIIGRLANSVKLDENNDLTIDFKLRSIESAQIFSIGTSIISLAWCYAEYNSVRKNMLLDITESPGSRMVMCFFMFLQIIARLLSFMLFTLYWGPGNFYPLMIFIVVHMILAAIIHIVFSEDLAYWKKGYYLKFLHNVMMNSFASIYFHNYLRFDEMPSQERQRAKNQTNDDDETDFVDSQRPGLHISTFLRQLTFDVLYVVEYIILLSFGLLAKVKEFQNSEHVFVIIILVLSLSSLVLRLIYYGVMHVWRNVIFRGKKLIRREIKPKSDQQKEENPNDTTLTIVGSKQFFKYVFISRNTWILGFVKHIEITLIVLPKRIIDMIRGRGQDLEYGFNDIIDDYNPLKLWKNLKFNKTAACSLLCFPVVILFFLANLAIILLLIIVLVMALPVAFCIFLYNLKSGFKAYDDLSELDRELDLENGDDNLDGNNTLELPPDVESCEAALFQCIPSSAKFSTLSYFQKCLTEKGEIDLSKHSDVTVEEFDIFAMLLLALNRKTHPMKRLILDNCDLTDDKLEKLAPIITKFDKVTLNGSQKMTHLGWNNLGAAIKSTDSKSKLKKLEMKIAKNEAELKFRKDILLEEFQGPTMTADSLSKIAEFIPYLEKAYLDDDFINDNSLANQINPKALTHALMHTFKGSDNTITGAWKCLAQNILASPEKDLKLRSLSLPGCAITDDTMKILSPALVKIKAVHLGRNQINAQGWLYLDGFLEKEINANIPPVLIFLSLSTLINNGSDTKIYLKSNVMETLSHVIMKLEEVDLTGQKDIGVEGWVTLCTIAANTILAKGSSLKLKKLKLGYCGINKETKDMLEGVFNKTWTAKGGDQTIHMNVDLDFSEDRNSDETDNASSSKTKKYFLCCFN